MPLNIEHIFDLIEDKITEETGPMARFILNKVLWDLGKKKEDFTMEDISSLIARVTETAISDTLRREKVRQDMDTLLLESTNT